MDYDFSGLSDFEFENLVRDLYQAQHSCMLQSYERGRDFGIDCRYLGPVPVYHRPVRPGTSIEPKKSSNQLIVQCKHYRQSGYSKLFSDMKNKELPKIKKLNSEKYVLATSVGITPEREAALIELLAPFCGSVEIWGRTTLNNFLGRHPDVEKMHFKLWLTSVSVIQRLLNNQIYVQSDMDLRELKKKLARYVHTSAFNRAMDKLNKFNYCIVAGIPGIGKTTLAQVIAAKFVNEGYEFISGSAGVLDALKTVVPEKKQFFLLDDFLGQNILELNLQRNEDHQLLSFMRLVAQSPNKKLVLTTREYVLNYAKTKSEKLNSKDFAPETVTVQISDHNLRQRTEILYNHFYFSDIPDSHLREFVRNAGYRSVVHSSNFSPRVIEWLTDWINVQHIAPGLYADEYQKAFSDPKILWEHLFDEQLSEPARLMLLFLGLVADGQTEVTNLMQAVNSYERHCSLHPSTSVEVRRALKVMDGSLVRTNMSSSGQVIRFHNPSIRDFALFRALTDPNFLRAAIQTTPFFDMVQFVWNLSKQAGGDYLADIVGTGVIENLVRTIDSCNLEFESHQSKASRFFCRFASLLSVAKEVNSSMDFSSLLNLATTLVEEEVVIEEITALISLVEANTNFDEQILSGFLEKALSAVVSKIACFGDLMAAVSLSETAAYRKYSLAGSPLELFYKLKDVFILNMANTTDVSQLESEITAFRTLTKNLNLEFSNVLVLMDALLERLAELHQPLHDEEGDEYRESSAYITSSEMSRMFENLLE